MVCTFLGPRQCPPHIEKLLDHVLDELIRQMNVDEFLLSDGDFDQMVQRKLLEAKTGSFGIKCAPSGMTEAEKKRWMVEHCDIVIIYLPRTGSGLIRYIRLAEKLGKQTIHLTSIKV